MFANIGTSEIILVIIVALILFGPNKLPEIGRTLGRTLRDFKKATQDMTDVVDFKEIKNMTTDLKKDIMVPQSRNISRAAKVEEVKVEAADAVVVEPQAVEKNGAVSSEKASMNSNEEVEEVETRV